MLEAVQERLDRNPNAMRTRREVVEHPFGTIKMRMGATHFLCKRLPKVATEMALAVLTYNLTRVMNIVGVKPLMRSQETTSCLEDVATCWGISGRIRRPARTSIARNNSCRLEHCSILQPSNSA